MTEKYFGDVLASFQNGLMLDLRVRLAVAWASTSSVSAAKPITKRGRCLCCAKVARMSGFSIRCSAGTLS